MAQRTRVARTTAQTRARTGTPRAEAARADAGAARAGARQVRAKQQGPKEGSTREQAGARREHEPIGRFLERFAQVLVGVGFPRMPARVFVGLLITEDGRLTAVELATLLRVSPAAISGAVRYLMQLGLVAREREPGERRERYRLYDDTWYTVLTRRDQMLLRLEEGLRDGIAVVGPETAAGARLDETRRFFEFTRGEVPRMLRKWQALRAKQTAARNGPRGR